MITSKINQLKKDFQRLKESEINWQFATGDSKLKFDNRIFIARALGYLEMLEDEMEFLQALERVCYEGETAEEHVNERIKEISQAILDLKEMLK